MIAAGQKQLSPEERMIAESLLQAAPNHRYHLNRPFRSGLMG
jgi:hypothetical protein